MSLAIIASSATAGHPFKPPEHVLGELWRDGRFSTVSSPFFSFHDDSDHQQQHRGDEHGRGAPSDPEAHGSRGVGII